MRRYDPATGELREPWPGDSPLITDKTLNEALSTSPAGLREVASPVPGGGVMVDLRGRFQHTATASIDDDGSLKSDCEIQPSSQPPGQPSGGGEE